MKLEVNKYYHVYNRSNNLEMVFKENENYLYFLKKYRDAFENDVDTIAYCLMPTHFHFLILVKSESTDVMKKKFGRVLSSYTRAINKRFDRHGSLFQEHTKALHVDDEKYLLTLLTYIHQNPVRAKLVSRLENWSYSSYSDYIGTRNGTLPKKEIIRNFFTSVEEFRKFSDATIPAVEKKYWV